jgi:hypothetical protein
MPSFGRRWSAAPPHGGSPFGWAKEPSTNGRRSHGLCRPGPTRRRPSLERAPHRVLRRRRGFSLELVPARELSAACLTDDRRKLRFFGPRRSDRILQHDMTHGHDLYGLLLLSRAGLAGPGRVRPCSRWRAVSILRNRLDDPRGPILPARCFTGVCRSTGPRAYQAITEPQPTFRGPSAFYLRRRQIHPRSFDCGGTGRRSRAKDWHVPRPGCGGCSVRVPLLEGLRTSSCRRSGTHDPWNGVARCPQPAEAPGTNDTPRRVAPFREPGCLEPFLGHDGGGDCSPEDRSSLACALRHRTDLWVTPPSREDLADGEANARLLAT